ncbi:hypothetical protein BDK51DRAFT_29447 [Blyttiomyces helicus]|uniref:Uncharacterized protein n=1 Tax=Blyttiomyces helicus TaxID=388810 RepID=A0A4P9WEL2_9FUNG|nr:hypothetical protein BDK51DRAFT_29447 [Blyttiomyces helicus]|eukprot:RKO88836.1 hypothetical protein BDK51DRAFT_29447 [Blyttiomyces helicus]
MSNIQLSTTQLLSTPTPDTIINIGSHSPPTSSREIRRFILDTKTPRNPVTAAIAKMGLQGTCGFVQGAIQVVIAGPHHRMEEFWEWILEFRLSHQNALKPCSFDVLNPEHAVFEGFGIVDPTARSQSVCGNFMR